MKWKTSQWIDEKKKKTNKKMLSWEIKHETTILVIHLQIYG